MAGRRFKLLYDATCPICQAEARWLRRWNTRGDLELEDYAAPGFDPARYGLTRAELDRALHGVTPAGEVVRGMAALRHAYRAVALGWLVAPTGWPVLRWGFDGLYRLFAWVRPSLGRLWCTSCRDGACERPSIIHANQRLPMPEPRQPGSEPTPQKRRPSNMHEDVETWCDTCSCEPEPRWQKVAEEQEREAAEKSDGATDRPR